MRAVPGQAHLDTRATTVCQCLRIQPVNGPAFGMTTTNIDLAIDDGQGEVTYRAPRGFEEMAFASTSGQAVDNSEAKVLVAESPDQGITPEMVNSGYLDDAKWHCYLVNWADASIVTLIDYGFLGPVRTKGTTMVVPELRGLSQVPRQKAVCQAGSKTCKATYGDASTGCPATPTWTTGATVTGVGAEADRIFTTAAAVPQPGNIRFTSGANSGLAFQVESVASGTVTLETPTPYPIEAGATFSYVEDCDKSKAMCIAYGHIASFRGEPHRMEAVGDALATPGASV